MSAGRLFQKAIVARTPLLLPVAHDALTARIIEDCGLFDAYQVGGFALDASREALPDIGLRGFDAQHASVAEIMEGSSLPLLVDADTGYGDVKMVWRVVSAYETLGCAGVFIEDQKPPKKCGHMTGKEVIPIPDMLAKLRAAMAAKRDNDFFILARTDAIEPEGVDEAIRRALWYADVADGVYVEGIKSQDDLARIGIALKGQVLATSILENGGETPWTPPATMAKMGYSMVLYPTTVLFQVAKAAKLALTRLALGLPMSEADGETMTSFEKLLELDAWKQVEELYKPRSPGDD